MCVWCTGIGEWPAPFYERSLAGSSRSHRFAEAAAEAGQPGEFPYGLPKV
jgi:hypothetical protein